MTSAATLFVFILTSFGVTLTTVPFGNMAACEVAAKEISQPEGPIAKTFIKAKCYERY